MIHQTITVNDLRKKLKAIGFNVKVKSLSFGLSGVVVRMSDGKQLPEMFLGELHLNEWKPAIDAITGITVVNECADRVSGPWSGMKA